MNSNAQLDALLRSPVGLAHRAAGGIELAGKQKYKNSGNAEELFETWHLDVWASNGERLLTAPRALDTSLDGWTDDISDTQFGIKPSKDAALKFRLLLTRPPHDSQYPWPKYHDQGRQGYKQIHYLPFFEKDMKALMLDWHLPPDWLYLRPYAKGCGNYVRKTIWNENTGAPERIGNFHGRPCSRYVTYILPALAVHFPYVLSPSRLFTPERSPRKWDELIRSATDERGIRDKVKAEERFRNGDPFIWSVCLSHHIQEGTTRALFDGFTERMTADLCERLQTGSCFWSEHPLYLLIVLLDIYVGCTTAQAKWVDHTYHKLDGAQRVDSDAIALFGDNFSNFVDVERMLDFNVQLAAFLMDTLKYLEESGVLPEKTSKPSSSNGSPAFQELINNDRNAYIKVVNRQMKESLTNTINFLQNQLHFIVGLQKRNSNDLGIVRANLFPAIVSQALTAGYPAATSQSRPNR